MSLTQVLSKPATRRFAVYDLEWVPETYAFRLAGTYDGATYTSFTTVEALLNHMMAPERKGWWWYAHAGGLADIHFLLQKLQEKQNILVEGTFSGSSAISIKITWHGHTTTLLDSYWLLRDKLAHLAPYTGLAKGTGSWKCASYPACGHVGAPCAEAPKCGCEVGPQPLCMFTAPLSVLREYNALDCKILYSAIEMFQETLLDMGSQLQSTIASTAMRLFRTRYLSGPIVTSTFDNDVIRASYVASRVEVFRTILDIDSPQDLQRPLEGGKRPKVKYYDFNSMFPCAMTQPLPGALLSHGKTLPPDSSTLYFANAYVTVPEMYLPPLGATGKDGRIFFPTGSWRGWFSRADLELLERVGGRVESVQECYRFHAQTDLASYALDLYDRRARAKKAGQSFLALVLKFLLNSCYGKFGEKRTKCRMVLHPRSEACPHEGAHDTMRGGFMVATCVEALFPGVILITEEKDVPHEHVPIASTITSLARATLYGALAQCGEDLYYCDTDSLLTGKTLPTGDALGELKLEYEVSKGRFIQPKLYEIDGTVRSKGFARMTPAEFNQLVEGQALEVERMMRVKDTARHLAALGGTFGARTKKFDKRIHVGSSRPKRRAVAGGGTRPWTYEETQKKWKQ
jgi:DNA polymerase type B, organellar and viral